MEASVSDTTFLKGIEILKGTGFDEIAPLYSPELKEVLETICNDSKHPIIVMIKETDERGEMLQDSDGNPILKPTISNVNILYHINRVWNPFYYAGDMYIYDPELHYHRKDTDDVVRNIMACVMVKGHTIKANKVKEILSQIVNHTAAYPFSGCTGYLNIVNGVLNVDTGDVEPHSKYKYFDYVIHTPYKVFTETPDLYTFLDQYGNREIVSVLAKALWQRCYLDTLKELTVFYGDRDSGKTTAAELIQATLDGDLKRKANTGRILLHELLQRFGLAGLEHKTINLGDDLPDMFVRNAGRINELLGSVHHNIEKKGIDHFPTTLPAYNLFTTNNLPPLDDDDSVIWSKIRLVRFDRKFTRGTVRANLYVDIIKEQLLFRAVEMLRTWRKTPYQNDQSADTVRDIWQEATTSTDVFIAECLESLFDTKSPFLSTLKDIEIRYDGWCKAKRKYRYVKAMRKAIKPALIRKPSGNLYLFKIIPPTKNETDESCKQAELSDNCQTTNFNPAQRR